MASVQEPYGTPRAPEFGDHVIRRIICPRCHAELPYDDGATPFCAKCCWVKPCPHCNCFWHPGRVCGAILPSGAVCQCG
jgi:hypothetical protein